MSLLEIKKDGLLFDGKPFYMASGDIQYFRLHQSEWKSRLEMMKDFGLNTIQTYCPWNLHEPKEGSFDFSGFLDLAGFLKLCAEQDLKVLLRPSPYICGEWENGGLPWWLNKDKDIHVRCKDKRFFETVANYTRVLCEQFVPFLSTNGGPVIAVCIENEYGGFGSDLDYLRFLMDEYKKNGVDVPFYQTDNTDGALRITRPLGIWQGINYRIESHTAIPLLEKIQPDKPAFVGEYWSGRSVYWGVDGCHREIAPIAAAYRKALDLGAYVSFYMFCGGTNFGFMNGARVVPPYPYTPASGKAKFRAITTSYEVDALISEDGIATEKYYACRKELDEYLGKPVRTYKLPTPEKQSIENVQFTECADLFENVQNICANSCHSTVPMTFEQLDNGYGFVLYTSMVKTPTPTPVPIDIEGVFDRAQIFADGKYLGTLQRGFEHETILMECCGNTRLDILVENMGRTNTRPEFYGDYGDFKGIKNVLWNHTKARLYDWQNTALPMTDISDIVYGDSFTPGKPTFFRAHFNAKAGVSTNLCIKDFGKGFAYINGFNIGRFWNIGPQQTLYVSGGLLKEGENELVILELHTELEQYCSGMPVASFVENEITDGAFRDSII